MSLSIVLLTTVVGMNPVTAVADVAAATVSPDAAPLVESAPLNFAFDPGAIQDSMPASPPVYEPDRDPAVRPLPLGPEYGTKGTSRWNLHFGHGVEFSENSNKVNIGGVGFSYFIARGLSVDLELNGVLYDQQGEDAGGGNVNLLFRWHAVMRRNWTFYLDAGAGIQQTNEDVPPRGSKFNFTPQAGLGFTYDIGNETRLMLGARWHHVSNANLFDDNSGRDSIFAYVQISFPY